jgi:hypothetical protein
MGRILSLIESDLGMAILTVLVFAAILASIR